MILAIIGENSETGSSSIIAKIGDILRSASLGMAR